MFDLRRADGADVQRQGRCAPRIGTAGRHYRGSVWGVSTGWGSLSEHPFFNHEFHEFHEYSSRDSMNPCAYFTDVFFKLSGHPRDFARQHLSGVSNLDLTMRRSRIMARLRRAAKDKLLHSSSRQIPKSLVVHV